MIATWYAKLNPRERILALAVAGLAFVLLNLLIWSWLFGAVGRARADLAARKDMRKQQAMYMKERDLWTRRDQWLQQHQPVLQNAAEASTLLDQLKQAATQSNVLIENPQIGSGETTPYRQTVFASIETKSHWDELVRFLYEVQQPEAFIVFENVTLSIDGGDPSMMRGKLKVARWFAPAQRKKG